MRAFRAIVFAAALAGLGAGLATTAAQQLATVPLILKAEVYETAGEGHDHGPGEGGHDHDAALGHDHDAAHGHDHGDEGWAPADGLERTAFTTLANVVTWTGFGLILVAGLVLAGRTATWREGLLWGLAGFAAVMVAPAFGLPPELPGIPAAPLGARQLWWLGTAVATAGGLGLVAFARTPVAAMAAVLLLALPHVIGAPHPAVAETAVPEELSRRFVAAVMVTSLLSWSLLGGLAGWLYGRLSR